MLLLRDVQKTDLPGLKRLAAVLNSVNLPNDEEVLSQLIDRSTKSFTGALRDPFTRDYLFVLEDLRRHQILGTSMIIAQHGTKESPHISFQVTEVEHYSASIDKHFRHKVLSIGYNYEGPTEIGGLVVDPPHRSGPDKPGKQLSYVRFLYMALHKDRFRPRVLAELLPPLGKGGRSLVWDACGKKFTGLEYGEADLLSRKNKEFIKELFPASDIYTTLFPPSAQKIIGEVGEETRGVQRMLERVGFKYVSRIDPFDGGPHYEADLNDVSLVKRYRTAKVGEEDLDLDGEEHLVASEKKSGKARFHAVKCHVRWNDQIVHLPARAKEVLGVEPGEKVSLVPFE
jgi:arginine N-succinyltransferase